MSRELSRRSIDHVVLERGRIGNSWHAERWDSLRLLTPNWMSGLFGHLRRRSRRLHVRRRLRDEPCKRAADIDRAPVMDRHARHVPRAGLGGGYRVQTDQGALSLRTASCSRPASARSHASRASPVRPADVRPQLTPQSYKRPSRLPDGRSSSSVPRRRGLQIARELARSGRPGDARRRPAPAPAPPLSGRRHPDAGCIASASSTRRFTRVDDLERLRRLPSLPLSGRSGPGRSRPQQPAGLSASRSSGRLVGCHDGNAWFSGSAGEPCASSDLKLDRLLDRIDELVRPGASATTRSCRPLRPDADSATLRACRCDLRAAGRRGR